MSRQSTKGSPGQTGYRLVLFDLDGTLVDSAPDIAAALDRTLVEAGGRPLGEERVRGIIGEGAARLVERAVSLAAPPGPGADVPALLARFRVNYEAHLCVRTRPYPGVVALLDRLAALPLAVLTNKPGHLARGLLAALGLVSRFARVVGDGDGYARKPAPDAARALMSRHGAEPGRTIVVGDGRPDLALARALGTPAVAVAWGYTPRPELAADAPALIADHPIQVSDFIGL